MECFEHMGYWWLPEYIESRKRIRGKLSFDPATGGRLRLYGQLYPSVDFSPLNPKEIGIIHGEIDGVAFTLQGCYAIESYLFSDVNETLVDAVYIYKGHHFKEIEDIAFQSVTVSYPYLDEWIDSNRFEVSVREKSDNGDEDGRAVRKLASLEELAFLLANVPFEPVEFYTEDDFDRRIHYSLTKSLPDKNAAPAEWKHRARISITPNEILPFFGDGSGNSYSEIVFVRLANFLTLATSRVNDPLSVWGTVSGTDAPSVVSVYCPTHEPESVGVRKMLFTFDDVKDDLSKYFSNWNRKYDNLQEVYDLYFRWNYDLHKGQLSHPTTQFLDMARALEVYHRRLYDEPYICKAEYKQKKKAVLELLRETFDEELSKKLVDDIGRGNLYSFSKRLESILNHILRDYTTLLELFLGDLHKFQRTVVDTRNDLTHILERPGKNAIDRFDIKIFHEYVTKTRLLLRMCFLVELKLSPDQVNRIMNRELDDHRLL